MKGGGRRRSGKEGQEVPVAFCTALCVTLFFLVEGTQKKKERRRGGDGPLLACQELSHNPLSDLRRTVHSLSIQPHPSPPPNASSHPSLLISTPLLCALPPLLSSSPSSVAGETLSGTADRYVNWAGALTRTACKIILGAAKRQVIKLNFRPVDLIGTGN